MLGSLGSLFDRRPQGQTRFVSPDEMKRRRALAAEFTREGASTAPIQSGWQGLARISSAVRGALEDAAISRDERAGQEAASAEFSKMFGGMPAMAEGQATTRAEPQIAHGQSGTSGNGAFPASLIQTESGGNWQAKNDVTGAGGKAGHFGRLQFGQARLEDAARAGAIPQGVTPEQFMANPQMQRAAETWHFSDIDNYIQQNGLDRAIGANINGTPVTLDGMRAVAHLGGKDGLKKFVETGGRYNPADANGTSLMAYMARHGGQQHGNPMAGVPQPAQGTPAGIPAPAGGEGSAMGARALALMGSPAFAYLSPGQQAAVKIVADKALSAGAIDPLDRAAKALQIEKMRKDLAGDPLDRELKGAQIAKMKADMEGTPKFREFGGKVYQEAPDGTLIDRTPAGAQTGYQPMTPEQRRMFNVPDGTPAYVGPDGKPNFGPASRSEQGEFRKKADAKLADYFSTHAEGGSGATNVLQEMEILREVSKEAPQGFVTGRAAQMFPGLSTNADVFNSRIQSIVPQLRVAGSGATSDKDMDTFRDALPSLKNTPEANQAILGMVDAKARINLERSEISRAALRGEIDPAEADKRLRSIDQRSILTPEVRAALGIRGPAAQTRPQPGADGWTDAGNGIKIREKR